jgi:hypothetical protein
MIIPDVVVHTNIKIEGQPSEPQHVATVEFVQGVTSEDASAAITAHDANASAHASIRTACSNETTARTTADAALQSDIDTHKSDETNPHQVTLQQAATEQATTATILPTGTAGVYEGAADPENKLLTRAEVQAESQGAMRYKGQLKYGAMTVDDMDGITGMQVNDMCGVQATQLTYKWDGEAWQAQTNGDDATGDLYDILFWYGTWVDGNAYSGDVSAQIKCKDGETHDWDLVVQTNQLTPGAVTDLVIGDRTLLDNAGLTAAPPIQAKNLTAWLQALRDGIKGAFAAPRSVSVPFTLVAEDWDENKTQTVSIEGVTLASGGIPMPDHAITQEQVDALNAAACLVTDQAVGEVTFTCFGSAPTVDIPMFLLLL